MIPALRGPVECACAVSAELSAAGVPHAITGSLTLVPIGLGRNPGDVDVVVAPPLLGAVHAVQRTMGLEPGGAVEPDGAVLAHHAAWRLAHGCGAGVSVDLSHPIPEGMRFTSAKVDMIPGHRGLLGAFLGGYLKTETPPGGFPTIPPERVLALKLTRACWAPAGWDAFRSSASEDLTDVARVLNARGVHPGRLLRAVEALGFPPALELTRAFLAGDRSGVDRVREGHLEHTETWRGVSGVTPDAGLWMRGLRHDAQLGPLCAIQPDHRPSGFGAELLARHGVNAGLVAG